MGAYSYYRTLPCSSWALNSIDEPPCISVGEWLPGVRGWICGWLKGTLPIWHACDPEAIAGCIMLGGFPVFETLPTNSVYFCICTEQIKC